MTNCNKKKDEKCLKKSNLLVYQQPTGKRTERKVDDCKGKIKIPICTPQAKPVRICTAAEMRRMCPPPVCPCEPIKKPKFGLMRFLGFGLKSALAAALVYISYDMGIWGTTDDTQQLYSSACSMFGHPQPKKNRKWDPPSCEAESELFAHPKHKPYEHCENPPISAEGSYLKFKHLWNGAVSFVFHGLAGFPSNLTSKENKEGKSEGDGTKQEPACVSYRQMDEEEMKSVKNVYK